MIQYRKIDTPENYVFDNLNHASAKPVKLSLSVVDVGVFHLQGQSERWPAGSGSIAGLAWKKFSDFEVADGKAPAQPPMHEELSDCQCTLDDFGSLNLILKGTSLLLGQASDFAIQNGCSVCLRRKS